MLDKKIEEARKLFLTDVDPDTKQENLEELQRWEKELNENTAMSKWQNSDITKQVNRKATESYKDASLQLAFNRDLTPEQRNKLYATQDACLFILGLTSRDTKQVLEQLEKQITYAISSTKNY